MPIPGVLELVIVGVIVLLLFGKRIPSVMRSLGSSITEFKRGINDPAEDDEAADAPKLEPSRRSESTAE